MKETKNSRAKDRPLTAEREQTTEEMMSASDMILPCCCEHKVTARFELAPSGRWVVRCKRCQSFTPARQTKASAVVIWNTAQRKLKDQKYSARWERRGEIRLDNQ